MNKPILSHHSISDELTAYSDGALPDSRRAEIALHLRTCAECGARLRQVHDLDLLMNDLPPAPSVPFHRVWSKLATRLPNQVEKRHLPFRPARVAACFALAIAASLVGVVALASDEVMPDNPLYSVKHLRQGVQLTLASPTERPAFELALGRQRLHEAAVMVRRKHHDLALASLRDFHALLVDAKSGLDHLSSAQSASAAVASTLADLKTALAAVHDANVGQNGGDAGDVAAVDGAILDGLTAVDQVDTSVDNVVESPSPEPSTSDAPSTTDAASPEPSTSDTPPTESPPSQPTEPAPTDLLQSPAA